MNRPWHASSVCAFIFSQGGDLGGMLSSLLREEPQKDVGTTESSSIVRYGFPLLGLTNVFYLYSAVELLKCVSIG